MATKRSQDIEYLKDKYYWRALVLALRRAGYTQRAIASETGYCYASISGWRGHSNRRPTDPQRVIDFARPKVGEHMIRVCTKPEYDRE